MGVRNYGKNRKRNRLPTPPWTLDLTEAETLTEPSGKPGVLKGRGMGVRNYGENGSVIGYPPPMDPGSHRAEALTEPSGKPGVLKGRGMGVRNYGENGKRNRLPTPHGPWISQSGGAHRAKR